MQAPGDPIGADEADRILGLLAHYPVAILAISGGPDSMALMHLTAEWHARVGAPNRVVVATVDHCLREESAAEAAFVARAASALGLEHRTKIWQGEKPGSGVPAAARAARYGLLNDVGLELCPHGGAAVVTAHTLDDLAETFLMRLKRGSGVEGLSAMALVRPILPASYTDLLRPLLEVPKSRLIASLQVRGATWVRDLTNEDDSFERSRIRSLIAGVSSQGLTPAAIAKSSSRLRAANDAVLYAERAFAQTLRLTLNNNIFASLDRAAFSAGPPLVRQRLLASLIARFGGTTPEPQLSEIEDLDARLAQANELTATLGGAVLTKSRKSLRVWREAGRAAGSVLLLQDGRRQLWDNRFWVSVLGAQAQATVDVRCLGPEGVSALPDGARPDDAPARALWSLPGFYLGERLISVPTLAYHSHGCPDCKAVPVD